MSGFIIGRLAEATATKVQTIRYYECIGLLPPFTRTEGGHRLYDREDQKRLTFIRHARELGFPLDAIRDLLSLSDRPDQSCAAVDDIAKAQLKAVQARIGRLKALAAELHRMIDQCACGTIKDCRVIETLGDHALCAHEHGPVA